MEQRVPDVSEADVERVVRRDFPSSEAETVEELLRQADPAISPRVALAVLKLANGSLEAFHLHLRAASKDWRDVIASAEYPTYVSKVPGAGSLSESHRNQILEADWEQYTRWLEG